VIKKNRKHAHIHRTRKSLNLKQHLQELLI